MLNSIQNVFIIKCICKGVDYCYWTSYFQPSKDGNETRLFMQPLFFSYQFELVVTDGRTREIKHPMAVLRNWRGGASDHKNIKPPWSQSINIFSIVISYRERSSQICTQSKQLLKESLKNIQSCRLERDSRIHINLCDTGKAVSSQLRGGLWVRNIILTWWRFELTNMINCRRTF